MTTSGYLDGCQMGSEVRGIASARSGAAWVVNLNNGNTNWNNHDNLCQVRAVCAGECHGTATFSALYSAWRTARRGKKPSRDQLAFDCNAFDSILGLEERLNTFSWQPSPPLCFVQLTPKAREIHAPAFADRVVHHWLVPQLEKLYESQFIHDSYSNRKGKGTHSAVARLSKFVRQVASGQGGGYYLQLDISNAFNSLHRPTLWRMLKQQMERGKVPEVAQRAAHALINHSIARTGVVMACSKEEHAAVPPHKRLANSPAGCGIAIGNLSSQFFFNVYMDPLDKFVKHVLKAPRYLRYVDDFVLVHHDRDQLERWLVQITDFLRTELRLELKAEQKLRPLADGIDFLGYVVRPTHTLVRRRVVAHCRDKLARWERQHVRNGEITSNTDALDQVIAIYASYMGHFKHAASYQLRQGLIGRFPWLEQLVPFSAEASEDLRAEHNDA